MPTITIKKSDGSGAGNITVSDKLFAAKVNPGLVYQAIMSERKNSRQCTQSTKTRATVHHTTRKPYKQKGTGRARQGMMSAPHYRHGGVAMGPLPRDLHADMPKKMRRAAIRSAISSKAQADAIHVIDAFPITTISTKVAAGLLTDMQLIGQHVLVVVPSYDQILYKSFRNIPNVVVRIAPAFSAQDVVGADHLLFTRDALVRVEEAWGEAVQS